MYRVLEGLLEKKFTGEARHTSSVVMDYAQLPESEPVRQKLNVCRELRNLLTHSADENGESLVEPSQAIINDLYEIIKYVETPQPAISYATKGEDILRASPNDRALDVMRRMEKLGYSHAPVLAGGKLAGVFSVATVFSFALTGARLASDTRIGEFGKLLDLDARASGRFVIMGKDASYLDVRKEFESQADRNRRLAAVFITSSGDAGGELLGILTPWDVLGDLP
jgi:CBS domain-containing protein